MNRLFSSLRIVVTAVAAVLVFTHTQAAPSLKTLSKSCFILHDPSGKYDISPEWEEPAKVMHRLPILPDLTKRIKDGFDPNGILNPGRMYKGV